MYVATVPNRHSPPALLLRESVREHGKVRTRTLANLTGWPPGRIAALRQLLKGAYDTGPTESELHCGPSFGSLFALKTLADRLGITKTLGTTRHAPLALFLILVRVAHRGSRLSAVRWAQQHAVAEILGLPPFDEDDLYAALDWLAQEQERIETRLFRRYVHPQAAPPALVLYDVTSSYFEGQDNELAAFGYNRDKKRGKKQIVIGLLTLPDGEPLAVKVFTGNTNDPVTVTEQVTTLTRRFKIREVVFVGDRGMVKTCGKQALTAAGFRYITALTDPQIRRLLNAQVVQLDLFDETVQEVEHASRRIILRCHHATRRKEGHRRADKVRQLMARVERRNTFVREAPRADPAAGLRQLQAWAQQHRLATFVTLTVDGTEIRLTIDQAAQAEVATLDGCYALETDVPAAVMDASTVDARYRDLQAVERDFRTLKTSLLQVRPIFLRKATRTRGHVFVAMLALKIVREFRRRLVAEFGTTHEDPRTVTLEDALTALARLCLSHSQVNDLTITRVPQPDALQTRILSALGLQLPRTPIRRKS